MNIFTRKLLLLLGCFVLPALLSVGVARSQDVADPDQLPVEVMRVLELPAHVMNPTLVKSEKSYFLKFQMSNNSDDRLLGFTYHLIALDSLNKVRVMVSRSAAVKVEGYATKDLTLRLPGKFKIKSGDRVFLAVEELIGRELVWEVMNSREALKAYARGEYLEPEVKQVLNQVDSNPRPSVIY